MRFFKWFIHSFALFLWYAIMHFAIGCTKTVSSPIKPIIPPSTDTTKVPQSPPQDKLKDLPLMSDLIGVNGFHEDNVEDMKAVGVLRAYCNWDWFEGDNPGDVLRFQYSRGGWYFDDAFKKIKQAGIKTSMCFQGAIKNLQGTGNFKFNDKPIDNKNLKTTDPNSYKSISNTLYQIAARYGTKKIADDKLKSDDKLSGLNLLNYIEVWNEPDKNWEGANAQFSPEEYAAMLSICYDKIKEADPDMQVVMGGLATLSVDYIKKMKAWFDVNREDKKFAADVINVHIYAFNNKIIWGQTWPLFGPAETPEDGNLKTKTKELVEYTNEFIAGREVWVSEFGWDCNPNSALCPKIIPNLSIDEIQARWIVRGYLEFSAAKISKAQLFILIDPSQSYIDTFYGTSGLINRTSGERKQSWYYTYTLKNILGKMAFAGDISKDKVIIYKYKNKNGNDGAYVVWSNSSSNIIIEQFSLQLGTATKNASQVELTSNSTTGTKSNLDIKNTQIKINVTEKPTIILVDQL